MTDNNNSGNNGGDGDDGGIYSGETLRYDLWVEQALRNVIKESLMQVSTVGLPGDHHFYIAFQTQFNGVSIPGHLRAQHPIDMTIVLQHQFDDLSVDDDSFTVGLSFGGKKELLTIPYAAIISFADPSVNFALQLKMVIEDDDEIENIPAEIMDIQDYDAAHMSNVNSAQGNDTNSSDDDDEDAPAKKLGEVIALDAFRKK